MKGFVKCVGMRIERMSIKNHPCGICESSDENKFNFSCNNSEFDESWELNPEKCDYYIGIKPYNQKNKITQYLVEYL